MLKGQPTHSFNGEIVVPSSKSHTMRAILLAALLDGESIIHRYLDSPDVVKMIEAARKLGAKIQVSEAVLKIKGVAGFPKAPYGVIDAGNSGQVFRFVAAIAALCDGYTVLTGDESIKTRRVTQPLVEAIQNLGGFAATTLKDQNAPLIVSGPIKPGVVKMLGQDSQPVSAILMAAAFLKGATEIVVAEPGEKPWIDLTLSWLSLLGVTLRKSENYDHYWVSGKTTYKSFEVAIPGDWSSAAYLAVLALITNSELTLKNLNYEDVQGDKVIVEIFQEMGAHLEIGQNFLRIKKAAQLRGIKIDCNRCIDALPILTVLGCFIEGETILYNAAIARKKESDRILAISIELTKMGAFIETMEDGLRVRKSTLQGARLNCHNDHRIALALLIAALGAKGKSQLDDLQVINKSYPSFLTDLQVLGFVLNEK